MERALVEPEEPEVARGAVDEDEAEEDLELFEEFAAAAELATAAALAAEAFDSLRDFTIFEMIG